MYIMKGTKTVLVMAFLLSSFSMTLFLALAAGISNNLAVMAQGESMDEHTTGEHGGEGEMGGENGDEIEKLIPSITEWTGIFSLGIFAGLVAFKTNILSIGKNRVLDIKIRSIGISIVILSISAGIIHLLLVQEHSMEAFVWGLFFLISGISQIGFGIIFLFAKKQEKKVILCYTGMIGNALLVITFILVRLVTPPFSPEETPINELEPNGIITLIIEIVLVVLLAYVIRFKDNQSKETPSQQS
jgi:hypothetical protein